MACSVYYRLKSVFTVAVMHQNSQAPAAFTASVQPNGIGTYVVQAAFLASDNVYGYDSKIIQAMVRNTRFSAKSLYIEAILIDGLSAIAAVLSIRKTRQ